MSTDPNPPLEVVWSSPRHRVLRYKRHYRVQKWGRWVSNRDRHSWSTLTLHLSRSKAILRAQYRASLLNPTEGVRPMTTDETREESMQRLARAAFHVDSTHHFHEDRDGRPTCSCGFIGDARKRTQTEHITAAVMEAFDHD